jgi:hypothetical protein
VGTVGVLSVQNPVLLPNQKPGLTHITSCLFFPSIATDPLSGPGTASRQLLALYMFRGDDHGGRAAGGLGSISAVCAPLCLGLLQLCPSAWH